MGKQPRKSIAPRIIGGEFRGRRLYYSGEPATRPMKDRLREALFNLIGPRVRGAHALDLFAGTGALGLEALSRGATGATLIELHRSAIADIRRNVALLGVEARAKILVGSAFFLWRKLSLPADVPWLAFCSPPYDFYVEREAAMLELIAGLLEAAPVGSLMAVEADERFDFQKLPDPQAWNVRRYRPAVLGIYRKEK
jgi:16S rRNA (guanine(966)-N(2))-methyltransferase RsmD